MKVRPQVQVQARARARALLPEVPQLLALPLLPHHQWDLDYHGYDPAEIRYHASDLGEVHYHDYGLGHLDHSAQESRKDTPLLHGNDDGVLLPRSTSLATTTLIDNLNL